jgi:DNA-binding response OmpR family regulator
MPRILVIDADRDSLQSLQRALGEAGFTDVAAVPSGSFALTMIERDRPDLIVSHATIPDIDGFELCSIVRSDPALGNILFLLLVGADVELPEGALETGPDRCLVGEFNADTIVAEVKSLLSRLPQVAEPAAAPAAAATTEAAAAPDEAGTLRGSLGVMDLPDVAQAIGLAAKTGQLAVALAAGPGSVVFERGRVVHAEFGALKAEAAFAALVVAAHGDAAGTFCFTPLEEVSPSIARSMDRTIEQLLLSVAAEIDEGRTARR